MLINKLTRRNLLTALTTLTVAKALGVSGAEVSASQPPIPLTPRTPRGPYIQMGHLALIEAADDPRDKQYINAQCLNYSQSVRRVQQANGEFKVVYRSCRILLLMGSHDFVSAMAFLERPENLLRRFRVKAAVDHSNHPLVDCGMDLVLAEHADWVNSGCLTFSGSIQYSQPESRGVREV